ncbi:TonB-dependent receptor [Sphingomonas suaedae]|uniref:TonB-dependent receptor n=1 Tax=Sphingomonas suaedae TaxID=2599297 RepID=A0A518RED2_9SPHN|nr:TonB-dependent receptor [Sphingomonas suaedae]QDX25812.1 TonB-dependent receptor [Sphingomonas suaedae]
MSVRSEFALPLIALALMAPTAALADSVPAVPAEADETEQVVITAARTELPASALPLTVDVIEKEELDQQVSIAGSVVDAVANLSPSFSPTRQKLSGAGETLRGRSPLYAINGIPQSTPVRDGSRDGYTIDPFFLDRVELIYGSNALQGIGATGGVVNQLVAKAPATDGFSGRALLQGSAGSGLDDNGLGGKAAALVAWRGGAFDVTVGGAYEKRGVFYDGAGRIIGVDGAQGDTMASKSWSAFARLGWQLNDTARLELFANRFELKGDHDYVQVAGSRATNTPSTSVRGSPDGEPVSNRVETVNLTLTDSDLAGGKLVLQAFFNRTRDIFGGSTASTFQDVSIAPIGTLFDQSANKSRKLGARFSYEREVADLLTATVGFDSLWDRTAQSLLWTGRDWVPPTTFRSLAPFAQLNLGLFDDRLRLAGGVRYEDVKLKVDDFTTLASYGSRAVGGGNPSFRDALLNGGVILEPVKGIRAYASYAEGYTIADVGRILRAINQPDVDIDTFLDISPVVSNNREIGVEVKRGPLDASATYFWSSSKLGGLLVLNPAGVYDVQRQRIEIEGLEVNLGVRLPVNGLRASIGYAHLAGRTDSDQDGVVDVDLDGANISPDRLNLALDYTRGPLSARVQTGFYLARTFMLSTNPTAYDPATAFEGYNLTDAVVRYETGFGGVTLAVSNLFDADYITYNSDTISVTNDLRFFSGRGRVFTLGWDFKF